ncbi:hypothetical protein N7523_005275 [Penicillium sp. IBT 18751x]|nr:hypothetical protein N7523_005275 [Penicillium sp. IBT 18751x]
MHIARASWLLAACITTMINASDILEVDLTFPCNETYAPTKWFPIVFAFQNAERARYLNPEITYTIWNLDDRDDVTTMSHDLRWANWTNQDPYLAYKYFGIFRNESRWKVTWSLSWESCDEHAFETHPLSAEMIRNTTTWSTWFTVQNSAPKVDLIAATAKKTCPGEYGVAINVTDKTMNVPSYVVWSGGKYTNHTCAVVASSKSTPTPNPCQVHIDKTMVASMEASLQSRLCNVINPPDECPEDEKNIAQQLAVAGVACLLAGFGALSFFFV